MLASSSLSVWFLFLRKLLSCKTVFRRQFEEWSFLPLKLVSLLPIKKETSPRIVSTKRFTMQFVAVELVAARMSPVLLTSIINTMKGKYELFTNMDKSLLWIKL